MAHGVKDAAETFYKMAVEFPQCPHSNANWHWFENTRDRAERDGRAEEFRKRNRHLQRNRLRVERGIAPMCGSFVTERRRDNGDGTGFRTRSEPGRRPPDQTRILAFPMNQGADLGRATRLRMTTKAVPTTTATVRLSVLLRMMPISETNTTKPTNPVRSGCSSTKCLMRVMAPSKKMPGSSGPPGKFVLRRKSLRADLHPAITNRLEVWA